MTMPSLLRFSLSFARLIAVTGGLFLLGASALDAKEATPAAHPPSAAVGLVREGKATGVVFVSSELQPYLRDSIRQFLATVERSTGARLPVVMEEEEEALPGETARLFVGPSRKASALGLNMERLPAETYRILTRGNAVYVIGNEPPPVIAVQKPLSPESKALFSPPSGPPVEPSAATPASRPTLWALNRLLEEQLQVRWLWPGKLGTYTPRHTDFSIPAMDVTYQPQLLIRSLRFNTRLPLTSSDPAIDQKLKKEAHWWIHNHQVGRRGEIQFRHSFGHWWDKYSADHPDYFADLGKHRTQPFPNPANVKLRLSNPKVIEQIAVEYQEAGAPEYWNVCPNDGSGFDISRETRAWDLPKNQPVKAILTARANLTARYVEFWNRLYERLVKINPDVKLATYAYGCYVKPPPKERPLKAKAVIAIVPGYNQASYASWKGWSDTGSRMFLRPNWWHVGADAPYLPLDHTEKYLKFAFQNGIMGLDMDSLLGYWATQGIHYYMIARLMTHPELTQEEIVGEYTAAFSGAAPKIREYIDYWKRYTDSYEEDPTAAEAGEPSRYAEVVASGAIPRSRLNGSKYALPYFYGDDVLKPAFHLLDEAAAMVATGDDEAAQRVAFLRKGLESMQATRDQIARGQRLKEERNGALLAEFEKKADALLKLRDQLTREHVLWGQAATIHENRYKVLIRPQHLDFHNLNLDGM